MLLLFGVVVETMAAAVDTSDTNSAVALFPFLYRGCLLRSSIHLVVAAVLSGAARCLFLSLLLSFLSFGR